MRGSAEKHPSAKRDQLELRDRRHPCSGVDLELMAKRNDCANDGIGFGFNYTDSKHLDRGRAATKEAYALTDAAKLCIDQRSANGARSRSVL